MERSIEMDKPEQNEPTFTLLGRDRQAPDAVRQWAYARERAVNTCFAPLSDLQKVEAARKIANEMEEWRKLHRPQSDTEIAKPNFLGK
jgi:hypothetical protein